MAVKSFRESIAWQKAMSLAELVYRLTRDFPDGERYGLTSQLRRASVSIASNIAEGQGRLTTGEFAHFLGMARGSALEVETQLELASRLGFCKDESLQVAAQASAEELVRIVNAILTNLRRRKHGEKSASTD